jgi:hypothetical protein
VLHNFGDVLHGYSRQSVGWLTGSSPSNTDAIFMRSCGGIWGRLSLRRRPSGRVGDRSTAHRST